MDVESSWEPGAQPSPGRARYAWREVTTAVCGDGRRGMSCVRVSERWTVGGGKVFLTEDVHTETE